MTAREIVDALLRLVALVVSWPVAVVVAVLILRHPLRGAIGQLADRVTHLEMPGGLRFDLAIKALEDVVGEAREELTDAGQYATYVERQIAKAADLHDVAVPQPGALTRKTILWVDDVPANNRYERHVLSRLGATIEEVTSTEEAMRRLSHAPVDLVISDMRRRENGEDHRQAGRDLARAIQALYGRRIPLVFYTGRRVDTRGVPVAVASTTEPGELVGAVTEALSNSWRAA